MSNVSIFRFVRCTGQPRGGAEWEEAGAGGNNTVSGLSFHFRLSPGWGNLEQSLVNLSRIYQEFLYSPD